jgi:hypothetical protein
MVPKPRRHHSSISFIVGAVKTKKMAFFNPVFVIAD